MALTVVASPRAPGAINPHRVGLLLHSYRKVTFDSSYATGGEALTPSQVGLTSISGVEAIDNHAGYVFEYDQANSKLIAYWADNNAAADSALIEVANATDLSAVAPTFRFTGV